MGLATKSHEAPSDLSCRIIFVLFTYTLLTAGSGLTAFRLSSNRALVRTHPKRSSLELVTQIDAYDISSCRVHGWKHVIYALALLANNSTYDEKSFLLRLSRPAQNSSGDPASMITHSLAHSPAMTIRKLIRTKILQSLQTMDSFRTLDSTTRLKSNICRTVRSINQLQVCLSLDRSINPQRRQQQKEEEAE